VELLLEQSPAASPENSADCAQHRWRSRLCRRRAAGHRGNTRAVGCDAGNAGGATVSGDRDQTTSRHFPLNELPELTQFPGVQKSIPVFRVFTKILLGDEEARGIALGANLDDYLSGKEFTLISGQVPSTANEVCLEESVAEHLHAKVGDEIRIGARGLPWLLTKQVTGILKFEKMAAVEETASIFMPIADAARLGKAPGKATSLQVLLNAGLMLMNYRTAIQSTLQPPLVVNKPASAADMTRPTEAIINIGLNVAALLSVVAAVFIVINTFQISVTERRKQTALIRIVGATTDQVCVDVSRSLCAGQHWHTGGNHLRCSRQCGFIKRDGRHLWI
jgi:hypothetical protein